jgi:hypothetical protein
MANIRGLHDTPKDDDDDDDKQSLYTGGATSGMSVLGPPTPGAGGSADSVFAAAKAQGDGAG